MTSARASNKDSVLEGPGLFPIQKGWTLHSQASAARVGAPFSLI